MLCLPSAAKESRCDVCDEITDVFHKLSRLSSTVIDDNIEILVRFVSECMTDPAQLRASKIQEMFVKAQSHIPSRTSSAQKMKNFGQCVVIR